MKLLVFLPCLNEADTIAQVLSNVRQIKLPVDTIDILVVDDGSTDNSAVIAEKAGAIVLKNGINRGVGFTFQRAVAYAIQHKYSAMVNIDADGQFDTNDIPKLIAPIISGTSDFVSGSRFLGQTNKIENMSGVKMWGNRKMTQLINRLARGHFTDVSCGFRAYSYEALLRLNLHGTFTYTQETFLNLAFQNLRISEVPISVKYFAGRQSRVAGSISKYAVNTSKIIFRTYRDYQPLRFFLMLTLAFSGTGSLFLLGLFSWFLYSGKFSPHIWAGFIGGFLNLTGLLFFVLGIVADMFVRMRRNQEEIIYRLKKFN
jgi:glycosyltransferase involved in cell wall biosynthesis